MKAIDTAKWDGQNHELIIHLTSCSLIWKDWTLSQKVIILNKLDGTDFTAEVNHAR